MTSGAVQEGSTAALAKKASTPKSASGLLARLARWLDRDNLPEPDQLRSLFEASMKDVAANRLAQQWAARYQNADDSERRSLLAGLVHAQAELQPRGDAGLHLFRRLYAQSNDLSLLVDLRADMLRWRNQVAGLQIMEQELASLLASWFDVGMLELRHIDWDSPASLLEKLIQYEAVHEIRSWGDMRRRVAKDRRCYAFFHSRMAGVPLIFVEVAFSDEMASDVQSLLDPDRPMGDPKKARWAIFYSISNTQKGLRGISFGNFLLKRVIDELAKELPRVKSFTTLSPVPGFAGWLELRDSGSLESLVIGKEERAATSADSQAGRTWAERLRAVAGGRHTSENAKRTGLRMMASYLTMLKDGHPIDPVARFHLGNGARVERINWAADTSTKGLEQSCGMMVNYVYEPEQLDENRAHLAAGKPRVARAVQKL